MSAGERWVRVERFLGGLDGVRLHEDKSGRRWTVRNRLVSRQVDDETLLIRTDFPEREQLLDDHPETFMVRPEIEEHMKVLADIAGGDLGAVCAAIEAAWRLQRGA